MTTPGREHAPAAGGVAVAERPRQVGAAGPSPVQRVLAAQGSAGNGAVARVAAGGDAAARSAAGLAGAGPVVALPAAAPVPVGPIPEMVPGTSAAEAREAQPERRSWWDRVKSAVSDAISSIGAGLGSLSSRVLGAVADRARQIPGYGLLSLALGRDVVTRQEVPRTPVNLIGALAGLIPGGQAVFENIQRTGVIERAAAWFSGEVPKLGLTWESIQGLFRRAWDALGVRDLLDPAGAWAKIAGILGPPLQALKTFAVAAGNKLLEFVFEGGLSLAGPLGGQVMALVRRGGDVLKRIVRDPVGFAGNLVRAVRGGLGAFMTNIGAHLRTGLFGWLTGALRGAITLPAQFDLRGILSLVTQVLGLTWSWLRGRLVRLLGEPRVALLERAVDWVQRIATQGLSAIWEKIAEFATGLVDTVIGGIRDWVARSVVGAAITRLITMFNPAGAIIQAIIAAYNTVKFFIERAQQLAALANSVFDSISAIAGGAVGAAVTRVEQSLARALPVALGFLARLIGLGDIAAPVRNLIERARGVLDRAMDRVVEWLAGMGRGLRGAAFRVRAAGGRALARWRARKAFTASDGSSHTVFVRARDPEAPLMVASATPMPVRAFLADVGIILRERRDTALDRTYQQARRKLAEIDALRARVEAAGTSGRQPADVDALNSALEDLALRCLPDLIPIKYTRATGPSGSGQLAPGVYIKDLRSNLVATVTAVAPQGQDQFIRFRIVNPRRERARASLPTGYLASALGRLFALHTEDPRELFLGPTPGKQTDVGKAVERRMREEGKIVGNKVRYARDGRLYDIADCDMGHVVDAVTWWNSNGRLGEAQSDAVKEFMRNPLNYEFEPSEENRRRGAQLAARGVRYLPPVQ